MDSKGQSYAFQATTGRYHWIQYQDIDSLLLGQLSYSSECTVWLLVNWLPLIGSILLARKATHGFLYIAGHNGYAQTFFQFISLPWLFRGCIARSHQMRTSTKDGALSSGLTPDPDRSTARQAYALIFWHLLLDALHCDLIIIGKHLIFNVFYVMRLASPLKL
ncbi:hypothetical protein BGX38DRAFT_1151884 [Terfezia claveryi]|nr:hypothetical protein BGX38DRAFT_1151884 [Terfezia claveryi]